MEIQQAINEIITAGEGVGHIHDGYHTFDELYEHRVLLFLNLCTIIYDGGYANIHFQNVWWSNKNSDGSEWDGRFIVGISEYITYHVPNKYLWAVKRFKKLEKGKRDGHNSKDVLERLEKMLLGEVVIQ